MPPHALLRPSLLALAILLVNLTDPPRAHAEEIPGAYGENLSSSRPHEVLGLSEGASTEEIKQRFRKLSFIYHPDTGKYAQKGDFLKIHDAYQELLRPKSASHQSSHRSEPSLKDALEKVEGVARNMGYWSNWTDEQRRMVQSFSNRHQCDLVVSWILDRESVASWLPEIREHIINEHQVRLLTFLTESSYDISEKWKYLKHVDSAVPYEAVRVLVHDNRQVQPSLRHLVHFKEMRQVKLLSHFLSMGSTASDVVEAIRNGISPKVETALRAYLKTGPFADRVHEIQSLEERLEVHGSRSVYTQSQLLNVLGTILELKSRLAEKREAMGQLLSHTIEEVKEAAARVGEDQLLSYIRSEGQSVDSFLQRFLQTSPDESDWNLLLTLNAFTLEEQGRIRELRMRARTYSSATSLINDLKQLKDKDQRARLLEEFAPQFLSLSPKPEEVLQFAESCSDCRLPAVLQKALEEHLSSQRIRWRSVSRPVWESLSIAVRSDIFKYAYDLDDILQHSGYWRWNRDLREVVLSRVFALGNGKTWFDSVGTLLLLHETEVEKRLRQLGADGIVEHLTAKLPSGEWVDNWNRLLRRLETAKAAPELTAEIYLAAAARIPSFGDYADFARLHQPKLDAQAARSLRVLRESSIRHFYGPVKGCFVHLRSWFR